MAKIYLSPSSQPENAYAYGNTNEQEQCRRIAAACEVALKRCGFEVVNASYGSMYERVAESNAWCADLHVPIHTNSYDGKVSGTRIFCFSTTGAGYKASKCVFDTLAPLTPGTSENVSVNQNLYEVNYANAPTVYIEVEFHDVAACAKWIIENVVPVGEAIAKGICKYYGVAYVPEIVEQYAIVIDEHDTEFEADAKLDKINALVQDAQDTLVTLNDILRNAKVIKQ